MLKLYATDNARSKLEPGWKAPIPFVKGQVETVCRYSEAGK